jgi:hypothetical protein
MAEAALQSFSALKKPYPFCPIDCDCGSSKCKKMDEMIKQNK